MTHRHISSRHQQDGFLGRNLALFEAYVEYCFAPKHTLGEQLLDVRRDKKERAAFAVVEGEIPDDELDDDEGGAEVDEQYRVEMEETDSEPGVYDA